MSRKGNFLHIPLDVSYGRSYVLRQMNCKSFNLRCCPNNFMAEELIKKIELKNGLTLELYDASRRVAGDRWLVSLVARIAIPNNSPFLDKADVSCKDMEAFQNAFGEKILFEKKRERIFIEEQKKEETLQSLVTSFLSSTLFYLSNDAFPRNVVLSELKKFQERALWHKQ